MIKQMKKARMTGKKPKSNTLYIIIAGACLIVLIVAAWLLIDWYVDTSAAKESNQELEELAHSGDDDPVLPSASPSASASPGVSATPEPSIMTGAVDPTPVKTIREKLDINMTKLKEKNADICGWIYLHDTVINYAVVKGNDNSYYLNRGPDKKESKAGAIFVDSRNKDNFGDANTVIYGHNMSSSGTMFHSLEEYEDQKFFDSHKLMFIVMGSKTYRLDVFSVFITAENSKYRTRTFATNDEYQTFIDTWAAKSIVKTDVKMTVKDKMVTLSTCDHQYNDDRRIAIMAKLTEIDLATYDFEANHS